MNLAMTASVLAFFLGAFSALVAGIVYWGYTAEHGIIEEWVSLAKESEEAAYVEEIREELAETNAMVALLSHAHESHSLVYERIFLRIAGVRTGVVLRGIVYEDEEEGGVVHVRGVADTREDLVEFAHALEGEGFSDVDIPVGSFISERDIDFSLTFRE